MFRWDFMVDLGKSQPCAKYEVAGFIYYEYINQNGETHYFWEKLTLPLDSQTQCFLFYVQLLCSYDYNKSVIFTEKKRILQWKILNFGACEVGVENYWTKVPKAHHDANSGRTNRVAVALV